MRAEEEMGTFDLRLDVQPIICIGTLWCALSLDFYRPPLCAWQRRVNAIFLRLHQKWPLLLSMAPQQQTPAVPVLEEPLGHQTTRLSWQTPSKNLICDLERYFTSVVVVSKSVVKSKLDVASTTPLARVWMLILNRLSRASMCRQQPELRAQTRSRLAAGFVCQADKRCSWRGTRLTWSKTTAEDARTQEQMNEVIEK